MQYILLLYYILHCFALLKFLDCKYFSALGLILTMGQSYKTPSYALTFELGLIVTQPTL